MTVSQKSNSADEVEHLVWRSLALHIVHIFFKKSVVIEIRICMVGTVRPETKILFF